jgi:hypothetical protein
MNSKELAKRIREYGKTAKRTEKPVEAKVERPPISRMYPLGQSLSDYRPSWIESPDKDQRPVPRPSRKAVPNPLIRIAERYPVRSD